jgi:hypothetical protein
MRLRADGRRVRVDMVAGRMPLSLALRAFRSVRRVDVTRPVVELMSFRSPDGTIWCRIGSPDAVSERAYCATLDTDRSGHVSKDGTVELCDKGPFGCRQNWDFSSPRLAVGQTSALNGFACLATLAGHVRCTLTEGEHAGKGFSIEAASVSEVSPEA